MEISTRIFVLVITLLRHHHKGEVAMGVKPIYRQTTPSTVGRMPRTPPLTPMHSVPGSTNRGDKLLGVHLLPFSPFSVGRGKPSKGFICTTDQMILHPFPRLCQRSITSLMKPKYTSTPKTGMGVGADNMRSCEGWAEMPPKPNTAHKPRQVKLLVHFNHRPIVTIGSTQITTYHQRSDKVFTEPSVTLRYTLRDWISDNYYFSGLIMTRLRC